MTKYLIFQIGERTLGLTVSQIRQVVPAATLSSATDTGQLEGYLNLRGEAVPVIDLRARLGLSASQMRDTDFLIIARDSANRVFSIRSESEVVLVDQASTVSSDVQECSIPTEGLIRVNTQVVPLLQADALFPNVNVTVDNDGGGQ